MHYGKGGKRSHLIYARFEMCWFDHINPMVASMIAKVVNLPREEDMGTPTSNSHQSIEDVNHNTKTKCKKNSTIKVTHQLLPFALVYRCIPFYSALVCLPSTRCCDELISSKRNKNFKNANSLANYFNEIKSWST